MQNKTYSETLAISQSAIKDFRFKSPKKWKEIWLDKQIDLSKNEETFVFGSLVDTLLFTPELIQKRYYISSSNLIPTESIAKIIKRTYDLVNKENRLKEIEADYIIDNPEFPEPTVLKKYNLNEIKDIILKVCDEEQWNSNWKSDTRVNKIIEKGQDYFKLLVESDGKKIISSDMNLDAINLVNILKENEFSKYYFINNERYSNYFQVELFSKYNSTELYTVDLKAALDIIHVDHGTKTVRVVDFKTSHSANNFLDSVKKYGYCDQLSFYTYLLRDYLSNKDRYDENYKIDSSYKVLEPINIVIDLESKLPYIYEYNWNDIDISAKGNQSYLFDLYQTQDHNGKIRKGWLNILEEIAWHMQNNKWDYPKEQYIESKIKINLLNS